MAEELLYRLNKYLEDRSRIMGGDKSRSSFIEEAVETSLLKAEKELHGSKEQRDAAIVK